jgi:hypothetical protein
MGDGQPEERHREGGQDGLTIVCLMASFPNFDEMRHRGLVVLEEGLPPLTEELKNSDIIPVSCWTTDRWGVVQFIMHRHAEGISAAADVTFEYAHDDDGWHSTKNKQFWHWRDCAITDPNFMRQHLYNVIERSGSSIDDDPEPGKLAVVMSGFHDPEVVEIWLVQDGMTEKRPASGHFGGWTICTEVPTPLRVEAHDAEGKLLGVIEESRWGLGPDDGGALVPSRSPQPSGSPGTIVESAKATRSHQIAKSIDQRWPCPEHRLAAVIALPSTGTLRMANGAFLSPVQKLVPCPGNDIRDD